MKDQKTALVRIQSILTNHSAAISSAGANLRSIRERIADVWKTVNTTQVDRLLCTPYIYFIMNIQIISEFKWLKYKKWLLKVKAWWFLQYIYNIIV